MLTDEQVDAIVRDEKAFLELFRQLSEDDKRFLIRLMAYLASSEHALLALLARRGEERR